MTFRNLDGSNDWCFGSGRSDYVNGHNEVALNVKTRVLCFLGDCFFDTEAGIDWWNRLDKNQLSSLEVELKDVIIKTDGVVSINNAEVVLGADRKLFVQYTIKDIYSQEISEDLQIYGG